MLREVVVDGKSTVGLPPWVLEQHYLMSHSRTLRWRCVCRNKRGAVREHQVRRDRWQTFLDQRRAAGRDGDDVFLGVDI